MIDVETPEPGVALVSTDIDSLDSSSSTAGTVVLRFPNGGYLPLVATPVTLDRCHLEDTNKKPRRSGASRGRST